MQPWPLLRMNLSRSGHAGFFASKRSTLSNRTRSISTMESAGPRCPLRLASRTRAIWRRRCFDRSSNMEVRQGDDQFYVWMVALEVVGEAPSKGDYVFGIGACGPPDWP